MSGFREPLKTASEFRSLQTAVAKHRLPLGVLGLSPIHKAHIIDMLCGNLSKKALVVLPDEASATKLVADLQTFGLSAAVYPEREFIFNTAAEIRSHEYEQKRLQALTGLLSGAVQVVACSVSAAMQRTVPPEDLRRRAVTVKTGADIKMQDLVTALLENGYTRCDMVEGVGQFSLRGGILDLFTTGEENPIRMEFFGDTVETMSYFDLQSQRRHERLDEFSLMPSTEILFPSDTALLEKIEALSKTLKGKHAAKQKEALFADVDRLKSGVKLNSADKYLPLAYETEKTVFDYADDNTILCVCESANCKERAAASQKLLNEEIKELLEEGTLCKGLDKFCLTTAELFRAYEQHGALYMDNFARGSFDTPVKELITFTATQLPGWNGKLDVLLEDLQPILQKDAIAVVFGGTEKSAKTLAEDLENEDLPALYFPVIPNAFP